MDRLEIGPARRRHVVTALSFPVEHPPSAELTSPNVSKDAIRLTIYLLDDGIGDAFDHETIPVEC